MYCVKVGPKDRLDCYSDAVLKDAINNAVIAADACTIVNAPRTYGVSFTYRWQQQDRGRSMQCAGNKARVVSTRRPE